ncbi:hypothetical protein [Dapis sp. BLCC M172]|uniref:hypothetical protein n=1 Tax=Dapis sp. BLCC M172 TaxID=2975281 RepID=UPI003CEEC062
MLVKGIKRGKIIELLEEVNFPDNQEVLIEIRDVNDFGLDLHKDFNFNAKIEQEGIIFNNDDLGNVEDNSAEIEVDL